MGDTINIDWARAQNPPDAATSYANAFQAGLGLAKSAGMARASNAFASDAGTVEPSGTAGESWARSLTPEQRASVSQRAEIVGALSQGLASLPYLARAGALAHIAPALAAGGVPADSLVRFDPTDEALARVSATTSALQDWLGHTQP